MTVATILRLEPAALTVVERYANLRLGGKRIVAPYFMNTPGRKGRSARVGKGTADALERETVRLAAKYKFDLDRAMADDIRQFMIKHKLGIDCSGLVAWASHALVMKHTSSPLWHHIKYRGSLPRILVARWLRPVENLSARLLTDDLNAIVLHDLNQVKPGDLIRSLNGNHVLLITEAGFDKRGRLRYLRYVNSTEYDGVKYGIRYGRITVKKPQGHILEQDWIDGENGVNWIFNAANNFPDDTRVVRLKALV
jgi:hypothetical protein